MIQAFSGTTSVVNSNKMLSSCEFSQNSLENYDENVRIPSMTENISEHADLFLSYIAARGRSKYTLINYEVDLRQFKEYLLRQGIENVEDIDSASIRIFLSNIIGYGAAKTSAARKLSAVRGFVGWLCSRGILKNDPISGLKGPKLPSSLPRALSYEDTERLLTEGPEPGRHYQRDRLILELMYGSGLRVSELIGLDWENIEISQRTIRIFGKGAKERMVPFGTGVQSLLEDWRIKCRTGASGPVFTSEKGADRLTVRTVHRIVLRAASRTGLYGISPHTLRHCFATHMLERGAPLSVVQELLGHDSISTTQRYLSITAEQINKSYMKSHPRAQG